MIDAELLEILCCPETKQPVKMAPKELVDQLNEKVAAGTLRNRGGDPVARPIAEGLLREDGKILYPIRDGIPVLLVDEGLPLE